MNRIFSDEQFLAGCPDFEDGADLTYPAFRTWAIAQGAEFPTDARSFRQWVVAFLDDQGVQGGQRCEEAFAALCQEGGAAEEEDE